MMGNIGPKKTAMVEGTDYQYGDWWAIKCCDANGNCRVVRKGSSCAPHEQILDGMNHGATHEG